MPKPSACGYPDATNTGVPAGTALTRVNGNVHLKTPGMVYSGREVHGEIHVEADNITIEKTRVITSSYYPIFTSGSSNPKGTVVRDVEIDMQGMDEAKGMAFDNYRATRVWFHNGLDCAHAGENVVITDSFCDLPRLSRESPAHADGFQSDGGRNLTFRHNTIRNPNGQTAAILLSTNTAPIDNVVIDDNLMSGGGYTVYCGTSEGGLATNTTYTNNRISREFFPKGGYYEPTTACERVAVSSGNGWDGTVYRLYGAAAERLVKMALAREFRLAFTRGESRRMKCGRRSQSVVVCTVEWTVPGRSGIPSRRYSGTVVAERLSSAGRRYSLRIRRQGGGCRCSRLLKRTGSL